VLMNVANLYPGEAAQKYGVVLHVVCRLTDEDVLLGGEVKEFNNEVRLFDAAGAEIGSDSNGVELSVPGISKRKDEDAVVSGSRYPFVITLNGDGIDLMPGADKITLVDELGENIRIDTSSIAVKNTQTGEALAAEQWQSSVETGKDGLQTIRITIPDDLPLTITYSVIVNAPPNQTVTITNKAHWEGYAPTEGSSVNDSNFEYAAGGTVGADKTPQITLHKVDQYNNQLSLPGAGFRLTEMTLKDDGTLEEKDFTLEGVTGEDGMLTFGKTADQILAYNTVYRIQEIQAPDGYALEENPRYVLVAQMENGRYPDYSAYQALDVRIHYASPVYFFTAYNHRGEIEVTKAFRNADGTALDHRNGTYRFGLFADAAGTELLQETYVTYAYGQLTVSAKFTDVEFGKTYYVFELNDRGEPILDGQPGTVGGVPFVVSYDSTEITVTAQTPVGNVTVTNRLNYAELPRTGGSGTAGFTVLGVLLIAASLALFAVKRRREPRS